MDKLLSKSVQKAIGPPPIRLHRPEQNNCDGRQYVYDARKGTPFQDGTFGNSEYEPNVAKYLIEPQDPLPVKHSKLYQKPKWWRAQCGFRGLETSGTTKQMQQRLRQHSGGGMTERLKELESRMARNFHAKNESLLKTQWAKADSSERFDIWMEGFLYEHFILSQEPNKDAITVQVHPSWSRQIDRFKPRKVFMEKIKLAVPVNPYDYFLPGFDEKQTIVLGLKQLAVSSLAAELNREVDRAISRKKQGEKEELESFEKEYQRAQSDGKTQTGLWDVRGHWKISCPELKGRYPRESEERCFLEIGSSPASRLDHYEINASFNFSSVFGLMRFVGPAVLDRDRAKKAGLISSPEPSSDESSSAPEEDDDIYHYNNRFSPPYNESEFCIPAASLPSTKSREFGFRWRGEDTGHERVMEASDEYMCSLIFESPNALFGKLDSDMTGKVTFKGFREEEISEEDDPAADFGEVIGGKDWSELEYYDDGYC